MEIAKPFPVLRRAARSLARARGFTALCVVTLAVGIGAVTAVFSIVDAVLLRPLPYLGADRLVVIDEKVPKLGLDHAEISPGLFLYYRPRQHSLASMAIFESQNVNLSTGAVAVRLPSATASGSLFTVLRTTARLGRVFGEADDRPGAPPVAVLSDSLWRQHFGADRHVVGRAVRIDGVTTQIIGVMAPRFAFPRPDTALWLPMRIDPAKATLGQLNTTGVGRLAAGATPASSATDFNRLAAVLDHELKDPVAKVLVEGGLKVQVRPLRALLAGEIGPTLWALLGAVGFILAIACANVANLLIVRGDARQRELAICAALGAPRRALISGVLAESLLLGLAAGVLGVALAWGGVQLLSALRPAALDSLPAATVDDRLLFFALGLSLLTSVLFGLLPAWRSMRLREITAELKGGGRAVTAGRGRQRLRQTLVGLQLALAMVLLTGSALMLRSFRHLAEVNPGFDPQSTLTLDLALPAASYHDDLAVAHFWEGLVDRVATLPGVVAVGATSGLPLADFSMSGHELADQSHGPGTPPILFGTKNVSEGYLRSMGIPLLAGRNLERGDADRRTGAVLVSASLARKRWPKGALGQRLRPGDPSGDGKALWYTVVGVAGDVTERALSGTPPEETVYYPVLARKPGEFVARYLTLVVRTSVPPTSLTPAIRQEIARLGADLPVAHVRTLDEVLRGARSQVEFAALMVLIATAVALLLGAVGLYGFVSYLVGQRMPEIGVRMALGASGNAIRWLVVREALLTAAAAVALGLVAAAALSQSLESVLVQVSPHDPPSMISAPVLLVLVTLVASYFPADRAAEVEPLIALRRLD